jgi:integrase
VSDKRERRWGQGWVYRRGRTWWIQYSFRGKVTRRSSESENRRVAVDMLNDTLEKLRKGLSPDVRKTTFPDLETMLKNNYKANDRRSLDRVERALHHLHGKFGTWRAVDITTDHIEAYATERREAGAANATINRELAALKKMCRLAVRAGKLHHVPYVPMLQEDNVRKGFFEWTDFDAILRHLPDALKPVFTTAYVTGWRVRSEILSRQWRHVDFRGGWLRLEPGEAKNKEGRNFPLTPELRDALESQSERTKMAERERGEIVPWVFHRNGKPIKSFRRAWLTACTKAGLVGRIPHDFRRSAVRNLERAGVPRSAAMAMVGHKTESIYRRYAIADESMLKDGAEKLAVLHQADQRVADRKVVPLRESRE